MAQTKYPQQGISKTHAPCDHAPELHSAPAQHITTPPVQVACIRHAQAAIAAVCRTVAAGARNGLAHAVGD